MQKYQKENAEYFNQKAKEFYRRNKEEIYQRRAKNPRVLYSTIKRNAKIRNIYLGISIDEFVEWFNSQQQECIYCGIRVERMTVKDRGKKLSKRLSVDRINNDKGYEKGNLALACLRCNFIKSNLLSFSEMKEIGEKYLKPKWQL